MRCNEIITASRSKTRDSPSLHISLRLRVFCSFSYHCLVDILRIIFQLQGNARDVIGLQPMLTNCTHMARKLVTCGPAWLRMALPCFSALCGPLGRSGPCAASPTSPRPSASRPRASASGPFEEESCAAALRSFAAMCCHAKLRSIAKLPCAQRARSALHPLPPLPPDAPGLVDVLSSFKPLSLQMPSSIKSEPPDLCFSCPCFQELCLRTA